MAEHLDISLGNKEEKYQTLYPQIVSLLECENDIIANMANVSAVIQETFKFLWIGFYRVMDDKQLVLGPFQGPLACTRIRYGKGVCGTAWEEAKTLIVPDVDLFPGHIACSSLSRSEIVIPIFKGGKVIAIIDIDSAETDTFDPTDQYWLEKIAALFSDL